MKLSFLLIPLLTTLALTGCSKPIFNNDANINWLLGTWVVDRDKTIQVFVDAAVTIKGEGFSDRVVIAGLKKGASTTIAGAIKSLDRYEFNFTEDEYSQQVIGLGLGGEGKPYSITDRPASNQITITEGGDSRTYTKEGERIWYEENFLIGKAKIYLRKK